MIRRAFQVARGGAKRFVASVSLTTQNVFTALEQIWTNKGRSLLTTLGIIIAVTAIIVVVSFVEGFGGYMTKMLRGYGTQYLIVEPDIRWEEEVNGMGGVTMSESDIQAVRTECVDIRRLTPFLFSESVLSFHRATTDKVPTRGVTEDYQIIRNYFVDRGRFFGPVDVQSAAHVCVLGRTLLQDLQCDESIINDYIQVGDMRFEVVGILESKGSFMGDDQDKTIMIPYTTMLQLYPQQRERMRFLAEASGEQFIDQAESQIRAVLRRCHSLQLGQPDDFEIQRQDRMLHEFDKVRTAVTGVLAGIVSISLLVGGIGIMNVMFVSVTERTREIGLRKSVGGRRRDIMLQFLTEAVVLSTTGGLVGIAIGYAITYLAGLHPKMVDIHVPLWSVALALVFSSGAGIIFGIIPAFKAAILHPIDALRHE